MRRLNVRRSKVRLDISAFRLGEARLGGRACVQSFEAKFERAVECDGHGEASGCFGVHAKNFAASAELRAGMGRWSDFNRDLYPGTLRNQESAGKQNAAQTYILRAGVHFPVSELE
jgi:hypothetical protein